MESVCMRVLVLFIQADEIHNIKELVEIANLYLGAVFGEEVMFLEVSPYLSDNVVLGRRGVNYLYNLLQSLEISDFFNILLALNTVNRRSNELIENEAEDMANVQCVYEIIITALNDQITLLREDELNTSMGLEVGRWIHIVSEEWYLPPLNRKVHIDAMIDHFRGHQGSIVLLTKSIYLGPVSLNTLDSMINVDQGT